ncbi:MAG: BRO family protein [Bacteroidales bacterium]
MKKIEPLEIRQIRTVWNENEQKWYFVISDVVQALTKTKDAKDYTKKLRKYDSELAKVWSQIISPLEVNTNGGRQKMNCAKALGILRIILSIRSRKAKLFVKWLGNLEIKPFEKNGKIEISKKSMNEFFNILSNPDYWMEKRERYSLIIEKQPSFKKMNELEIIFSLLEENDIIYKKGLKS